MSSFLGEYSAKLDDKGRVVFPSSLKAMMSSTNNKKLVLKKDIFADCIEIYDMEQWEEESKRIKSKLNFFNKDHAIFWRQYMRDTAIVEPDEKLGRILVPKKMLESIKADKEVVFSGCDYKIELWAKDKYDSSAISNEEYLSIAKELSEIG